jgi:hypothetical protein
VQFIERPPVKLHRAPLIGFPRFPQKKPPGETGRVVCQLG